MAAQLAYEFFASRISRTFRSAISIYASPWLHCSSQLLPNRKFLLRSRVSAAPAFSPLSLFPDMAIGSVLLLRATRTRTLASAVGSSMSQVSAAVACLRWFLVKMAGDFLTLCCFFHSIMMLNYLFRCFFPANLRQPR